MTYDCNLSKFEIETDWFHRRRQKHITMNAKREFNNAVFLVNRIALSFAKKSQQQKCRKQIFRGQFFCLYSEKLNLTVNLFAKSSFTWKWISNFIFLFKYIYYMALWHMLKGISRWSSVFLTYLQTHFLNRIWLSLCFFLSVDLIRFVLCSVLIVFFSGFFVILAADSPDSHICFS